MSTTTKRKISCSTCRQRKIKCDGNKPCERCRIKKIDCIYTKPGQAGRPPKNAVVNKFVLAKPIENVTCREFIFENIVGSSNSIYLYDSKSKGLGYYLEDMFNTFVPPLISNNNKKALLRKGPKRSVNGQIDDLSHYFTWMSVDLSMIMIRRLSALRLTQYYYVEILQTAIGSDPSNTFFDSNSSTLILKNPLNALPPDQAIRLIDCFFLVHPYSIMFNKTILLQAYWTDTADPLLLSVIYGTALFMSQTLDGKPLTVWDRDNLDKRNPFLEYAHILLSKASSEVTLSRYQAVILLGTFEITFGYAKKGVSLFGLSYMIADQLGLFDHQLPKGLSPIERELLQITFWTFFQCIIRGCVELTRVPHYVLCYRSYALPPINTSSSLSYQFDIQNGHPKTFKNYHYLVESFYIQSVISKQYGTRNQWGHKRTL
ncbi:hypothetical protein RO3G_02901 [Rhizopus delemar RA 99-880]|uniref:Zn(2)-C6 fungal-type domain-containing protein n=1 Tax=Rhizopus delemar (strain RA 99-880 / ATCC MYA-4621 / FGSC 9543 / NRRL 43880) TaxID=246409 RepID=I1BPR7_RHIO9|nr:hypothetical protein RO3G_02901 [Rhizopus delemar RA 99-880]|eukprot:EIE78197.1 hypothetical protein RO3G_02901 [Rhizopus delemar RA 99-880]